MKKRVIVISLIVASIIFAVVMLSVHRIEEVNDSLYSSTQSEADASTQGSQTSSDIAQFDYSLGDSIDISGKTSNKKTASEGVAVQFDNFRIVNTSDIMDEYPDWMPLFGPSGNKYEDPKYAFVDMTLTNSGQEASSVPWFKLEAGSWSTVVTPNELYLLNGYGQGDEFMVGPGESKTFCAVYELWEPTFSKDQWKDVYNLEYQLVLVDYPTEIAVRCR